jgi:uncharacterized protein YjbJ (UPF0337 family)
MISDCRRGEFVHGRQRCHPAQPFSFPLLAASTSVVSLTPSVETMMNWTLAENNWTQFKGRVRARWMKFDDDQLATIAGKRPELLQSIQTTYGISRSEAEREIRSFEARQKDYGPK